MGPSDTPKQYLPLAGRSVIEWSLQPFLDRSDCVAVVVVTAAGDEHWRATGAASHERVRTATGGVERADSVYAGLHALADSADENDWVLVHDAARPCLRSEDLSRLIDQLRGDEVGGLLAAPVVDTLKRAGDDGRVVETIPRALLWRALTPQMFRYGILCRALRAAAQSRVAVTDEAQAVELLGSSPRLIRGDADNIKITVPEDLERAQRILGKL